MHNNKKANIQHRQQTLVTNRSGKELHKEVGVVTPIKEKSTKKPKTTKTAAAVRLSQPTRKILQQILDRVNKKEFGKRIKADDAIATGLSLIGSDHINQMVDNSLTNSDRIEILFRKTTKTKTMNRDEFLGKLLSGELSQKAEDIVDGR